MHSCDFDSLNVFQLYANLFQPESSDPDKVSVAVKAFITNDMPAELIELLEKILLEPTTFSDNPSLQNLLMLTAAKSDRGRVAGYIEQLDAYSPSDIAEQCIEVGMFDEAFSIYKKHGQHTEAVGVLVDHIVSIDRAQGFAEQIDSPPGKCILRAVLHCNTNACSVVSRRQSPTRRSSRHRLD